MIKFIKVFIFIIISSNLYSQWIQIGPTGGIVNTVTKVNNTFLVGTNSGIYLSNDEGQTWNPSPGNISFYFISSFSRKNNLMFASAYRSYFLYQGGNVLVSPDDGETWFTTSTNKHINSLLVKGENLIAGAGIKYIQYSGGVLITTNSGSNWQEYFNDTIIVNSLFALNNDIFAGTKYGIYKSTNNGVNWYSVNSGIPDGVAVYSFVDKINNIYCGTDKGVYISSNFGVTWVLSSNGLPQNIPIKSLIFNGTTLYAGVFSGGIFKSSNNGVDWVKSDLGLNNDLISNIYVDNNKLLSSTLGGGIFTSINNGVSWNETNAGLNLHTIWTTYIDNNKIYIGTQGGGVYLSTNNGNNWENLNNGLGNQIVYSLTKFNNNFFAATYGGIYKSTNSCSTWDSVNSGLLDSVVLCLTSKDNVIFAGTRGGKVYKSMNNGSNWVQSSIGITSDTIFALYTFNNFVFAGTYSGGVFRTSDMGNTWQQINIGIEYSLYSRKFASIGDTIFNAMYYDGIYKSTNNGDSWQKLFSMQSPIDLVTKQNYLFVSYYGSGIALTSNSGLNWTYNISNGGSQWGNRAIYSLAVNDQYLFAGTDGYSMWKRNLFEIIGLRNISNEIPNQFSLSQNYPNPFNPSTKIIFAIPSNVKSQTSNVKLIIFDLLGREVATIVNHQLQPGTYEVEWDASIYTSGVYFYRLSSDEFTESKKMLLIK